MPSTIDRLAQKLGLRRCCPPPPAPRNVRATGGGGASGGDTKTCDPSLFNLLIICNTSMADTEPSLLTSNLFTGFCHGRLLAIVIVTVATELDCTLFESTAR